MGRVVPLVVRRHGTGRAHRRPSLGFGDVSHFFNLRSQPSIGIHVAYSARQSKAPPPFF